MDDHRSKKLASISEKKLVRLENKLHVETVKYNNIATEKDRLREDIDTMLIEHELFETAYQQLLKKLVTGKKVMSDLMKLATSNFDQRDDATKHLQALKDRANQDQMAQTKEINKLQRYCGRQTIIRDFMATKGHQRITADVVAQRIQKKELQKEEMKKLREKYQKILDDIKEFTDQHDVDALTVRFIETQEENFAQFNCLNDMYNEIDEMENQINEINEEIERLKEEKETQKEEQIQELAKVQEELEAKRAEREAAEDRLQDRDVSLEALFRGIEDLFNAAGCDKTPTVTHLGENEHVTQHNVMMFLNLIELRTDELLNQVFYAEKSKPWKLVPCQLPIIKIRTPKKPKVSQGDKGAVDQPHICNCGLGVGAARRDRRAPPRSSPSGQGVRRRAERAVITGRTGSIQRHTRLHRYCSQLRVLQKRRIIPHAVSRYRQHEKHDETVVTFQLDNSYRFPLTKVKTTVKLPGM
ncbi:outer dynein arm-docking complex subunit 1-like [Schistocerca serialis cubense]|uniref:outer dynein arm-docking complex subunit 1-like n=1 Tax=Schistocerca serialis cubense TaxID=2023355 RepID=UPI00214E4178|nr:outer dynein arm-docking complex subunit 1-like [Schistocerca serialis cubense]